MKAGQKTKAITPEAKNRFFRLFRHTGKTSRDSRFALNNGNMDWMRSWIFKKIVLSFFFAPLFSLNCPPDLFSIALGSFDLYREKYRSFEFALEYKLHCKWLPSVNRYLEFRPLIGAMTTARGSFYGYVGLNFDLLFWNHLLFAPGFAAGYYAEGGGKNLGFPIEFRSGVELAWQFWDWHRFGLHFYHLSNASLGRRNPGEESLVLFYDIPLVQGFPFIREK